MVGKHLESNDWKVSDEMRMILDPISGKFTLNGVISCHRVRKAREVPMQVLPLHVGHTKGQNYRQRARQEKAGLRL